MNEMLEYALNYAKKGLAVFPLNERDKTPKIASGFKKATTDEMQIEAWWKKWPNANIGIATGQVSGGVCVIDVDKDEESGKDGFKSFKDFEDAYGHFFGDGTWACKTGKNGLHAYFKADKEVKCRIGVLPGVDIRGDGGYVVAPPSIHPNGNTYEWNANFSVDEIDCMKINDTIRYLITKGQNDCVAKLKYVAPEKIPQGERNSLLFKFAAMMQAKGSSDQTVFAATMTENQTKCNPPLSEREVRQIVSSVLKYEKGKPVYIKSDGEAIQGEHEPIFTIYDSGPQKGKIKKTIDNIREAIQFDSELYGAIKYNELSNSIFVVGSLPWDTSGELRDWNNADDSNLKSYLEKRYGFSSPEKIMDALVIASHASRFNPVVDALEQIRRDYPDNGGSIRKLLPYYMGAKDDDYNYECMKLFMLGAICRVYYPGCKFDYSLILYGAQGFGKSEFLRKLSINSDWFNDNFNTFDGDKAVEKLSGMWIVEMAELKALKSAKDSETFKAFLTSRSDYYRAPYSRRAEQRPRMCVFAGTTNSKNVFVDKTGNRRFLPIVTRKGKEKQSLFDDEQQTYEDIKKAWAEAMDIFYEANMHPVLKLPRDIEAIAEKMQDEFSEEDYRVGMIQDWLDKTNVSKVCVPMLIEHALGTDLAKVPKHQKKEIAEIMENEIEGWSRVANKKSRVHFYKYGNQISYIKDI